MRYLILIMAVLFSISIVVGCAGGSSPAANAGASASPAQINPSPVPAGSATVNTGTQAEAPGASPGQGTKPVAGGIPRSISSKPVGQWYDAGIKLWKEGNGGEALKMFDNASIADPEEALKLFDRDIAADKTDLKAWIGRALALEKMSKIKDAASAYTTALNLAKEQKIYEFIAPLEKKIQTLAPAKPSK
ncbi:MAG: hypothetical protein M1269_05850 [Chloroflexi bacterium]|nr:hypothetical protein [Chloroflexota bacterium]